MRFVDGFYIPDVDLPDRLSALIEIAVSDYDGLDREKYFPDSEEWHGTCYPPDDYGQESKWRYCGVCLAGAVIAGSFGGFWEENYAPTDFGVGFRSKLFALEKFRLGEIRDSLLLLGFDMSIMPINQLDVVRSVETDVKRGGWDKVKRWYGWDDLEVVKSHFLGVAARLRTVGL